MLDACMYVWMYVLPTIGVAGCPLAAAAHAVTGCGAAKIAAACIFNLSLT